MSVIFEDAIINHEETIHVLNETEIIAVNNDSEASKVTILSDVVVTAADLKGTLIGNN